MSTQIKNKEKKKTEKVLFILSDEFSFERLKLPAKLIRFSCIPIQAEAFDQFEFQGIKKNFKNIFINKMNK